VPRHPAEHHRLSRGAQVGHLEEDLSNNRVVGRVTTEALQSTSRVWTDKIVTSWLAANEKNSPADSIQSGGEDAVKTTMPRNCLGSRRSEVGSGMSQGGTGGNLGDKVG
jgi:hypothetical protein